MWKFQKAFKRTYYKRNHLNFYFNWTSFELFSSSFKNLNLQSQKLFEKLKTNAHHYKVWLFILKQIIKIESKVQKLQISFKASFLKATSPKKIRSWQFVNRHKSLTNKPRISTLSIFVKSPTSCSHLIPFRLFSFHRYIGNFQNACFPSANNPLFSCHQFLFTLSDYSAISAPHSSRLVEILQASSAAHLASTRGTDNLSKRSRFQRHNMCESIRIENVYPLTFLSRANVWW